ncbi:MAG: Hint domain-containing protein [Pseudomonadota bacterium]
MAGLDRRNGKGAGGVWAEARIATLKGILPVKDLGPGDRVLTRDNGYQAVIALVGEEISAEAGATIALAPGALGSGQPERAMNVAPGQRFLQERIEAMPAALGERGEETVICFSGQEVLVSAENLARRLPGPAVPSGPRMLFQVLLARHELILIDGVWSESMEPSHRSRTAREVDSAFVHLPRRARNERQAG